MIRSLLLMFLLAPLILSAQFNYVLDNDVPVKGINGETLTMPWAGGINAAQYNTLDINSDGKDDLVLFDRMADKVITFINAGNRYKYAPEYESFFPKDITNWMLLRDFNCDGKTDIFGSDTYGIKVYVNTTNAGENLSWKKFRFYSKPGEPKDSVLLTKVESGFVNIQLQYDDLPAINDIDGDGDIDILNMRYSGNGNVEYQKNLSKELYGNCDSLAFERVTQTWGNFKECECGVFAFNGADCASEAGGRIQHVGGKTLLAIDVDGDADKDLLLSEAECKNMYLLRNTGSENNSVIISSSVFPDEDPINFSLFPAAYYEDVDFDGIKDIIASPHIYTKEFFQTNLSASNWLYKNTNTSASPDFSFSKPDFLQDEMIDVGDNSVPAFADYDNDGDLDMFISQNTSSENIASQILLFRNIGTTQLPAFEWITNDYLQLSQLFSYNMKIHFADMNSDGRIDLVFTATLLEPRRTRIFFIANKGNNSFNFSGQQVQALNISLSYAENICAGDVDQDDRQDFLIGRSNGALELWRNNGALNFTKDSDAFLGLGIVPLPRNFACAIADLDADTKPDLVLTDQTGLLRIVSDYTNAVNDSASVSEIVFNSITRNYNARNLGGRVWPAVANLYSTDKPAIVVGNILGGVQILRNDNGLPILGEVPVMYPNPVAQSGELNIQVDREGYMQLFSSLGQKVSDQIILKPYEINTYKLQSIARGLYLVSFTLNEKTYTKRLVVY